MSKKSWFFFFLIFGVFLVNYFIFFYKILTLGGFWTTRAYAYLCEMYSKQQQCGIGSLRAPPRCACVRDACFLLQTPAIQPAPGFLLIASFCGLARLWGTAAKAALLSAPPAWSTSLAVCAAVLWAELRNQGGWEVTVLFACLGGYV